MTCYLRLKEIAVAVRAGARRSVDGRLGAPDGAAVAYLDRVNTPGTTLVSTIDPSTHLGHTEATNAGRFLDELLRWVTAALPPRRDGS